jgi:hypothetical protein
LRREQGIDHGLSNSPTNSPFTAPPLDVAFPIFGARHAASFGACNRRDFLN